MKATLICALCTPQDDRLAASSVIEIPYIADESEKVIMSDARDVFDGGPKSVADLTAEGILGHVKVPDGCVIAQGFPVTVRFADGSTKVAKRQKCFGAK